MSFTEMGLCDALLLAIKELGYTVPSPIQAKAIPAVLGGRDIMAAAQTGTGKTAGFALPILERLSQSKQRVSANHAKVLILAPTRELAAQISDSVTSFAKHLNLTSTVVYGGVKISPQMMRLRRGVDILVATPGRLLDLFQQRAIRFNQIETLVLDEADRMLDMGFIHDIRKIIALLPKERQNLLFSATFSDSIKELAKAIVKNPIQLSAETPNSTATTVKQWIHPVDKKAKPALLSSLIVDRNWKQVLVFTRTKHGANRLASYLEGSGFTSAAIHGNKSQGARTRALADFKSGKVRILVATDIAARGIDIDQLPQVVNFELPSVAEDYVHRIGRTGRAGAHGQAISLVCADEIKQLFDIEKFIKQKLPRKYVNGFEPAHELPTTAPKQKPSGIKSGSGNARPPQASAKRGGSATRSQKPGRREHLPQGKRAGAPASRQSS